MDKQTNLEDNLFVLNTYLRMIRDMLALDVDSGLFLAKTLDDLEFVNATLFPILDMFRENELFIDRDELCYAFYETEQRFFSLLTLLQSGQGCFSVQRFPEIADRITVMRNNSLERQKTIDEFLTEAERSSGDRRIVSSMEITELLKDFG